MGNVDVRTAVLASGLTVPYAETGNSAGEAVVFVHAYVESWRYFEVLLGQLPASMHAYAPTLRGHGDADKPAHGYLPEDFAADIVGFMDALRISSAVLVGSSSGALVSQIVASTQPGACVGSRPPQQSRLPWGQAGGHRNVGGSLRPRRPVGSWVRGGLRARHVAQVGA